MTGAKPATGTVDFYDSGTLISNGNALANGQAQLQVVGNVLGLGIHQFTAHYSGDINNQPSSTASNLTQVVTGTMSFGIVGTTGSDMHFLNATITLQ